MSKSKAKQEQGAEEDRLYEEFRARGSLDQQKLNHGKAQKVNLGLARDTYKIDTITEKIGKVMSSIKWGSPKVEKLKHHSIERQINLIISDTHFGANLDGKDTPLVYGPHEEARRFGRVIVETGDFKSQYRNETSLNVHLNGDIIQGMLHDARDGTTMADQVAASIQYITQGLIYLAARFPRGISVYCVTGNHGRRKDRHAGRAIKEKWDSYETMVYLSVKASTAHLPNVKVIIPKSSFYVYPIFKNFGFATHGDTALNPGNPGSAINTKSIEGQINKINSAFVASGQKPCSVFTTGHVHVRSEARFPGAVFMTNPCLIPPDAFSVSIGIQASACGQTIWESTAAHVVGDLRIITVDSTTDADASLEKIISPYEGFDL